MDDESETRMHEERHTICGGKCLISRSRFGVKRTGLASMLFAMLRPGEARAAALYADSVKLDFGAHSSKIALGAVGTIEANLGRRWALLRFRHTVGTSTVTVVA